MLCPRSVPLRPQPCAEGLHSKCYLCRTMPVVSVFGQRLGSETLAQCVVPFSAGLALSCILGAQNMVLVGKVKAMAEAKGVTAGQLALAWVHAQGDDVFPIPGAVHDAEKCCTQEQQHA